MAKLPPIKSLKREDFSDAPDWLDKLIWPVNRVFESLYNALNNQITVTDNMTGLTKSLTFTASSDVYPLKFAWPYAAKANHLWITNVLTNGTFPTSFVVDWSFDGKAVSIDNLPGLNSGDEYTVTFMVLAG